MMSEENVEQAPSEETELEPAESALIGEGARGRRSRSPTPELS
jgi:hypothetical protein